MRRREGRMVKKKKKGVSDGKIKGKKIGGKEDGK